METLSRNWKKSLLKEIAADIKEHWQMLLLLQGKD
jgi:hypothetical protein